MSIEQKRLYSNLECFKPPFLPFMELALVLTALQIAFLADRDRQEAVPKQPFQTDLPMFVPRRSPRHCILARRCNSP